MKGLFKGIFDLALRSFARAPMFISTWLRQADHAGCLKYRLAHVMLKRVRGVMLLDCNAHAPPYNLSPGGYWSW